LAYFSTLKIEVIGSSEKSGFSDLHDVTSSLLFTEATAKFCDNVL
jgi:hypothetical protein